MTIFTLEIFSEHTTEECYTQNWEENWNGHEKCIAIII
jgi:hypothetical protein